MAERWLTVIEAAEVLGVKPAEVRHQIIRGEVVSRFGEAGRLVLVGEPTPDKEEAAAPADTQQRRLKRLTVTAWSAAIVLGCVAIGYGVRASSDEVKAATQNTAIEAAIVNPPVVQ